MGSASHDHRPQVLLLYPGDSLAQQLLGWSQRHPDCSLALSFAKGLPAVQRAMRGAEAALVDATAEPVPARQALGQALARLDRQSVAVYTELMHECLELFVRRQGVLLLLGPLGPLQWEELLERMLRSSRWACAAGALAPRAQQPARPENHTLRGSPLVHWSLAGIRRPRTGVK